MLDPRYVVARSVLLDALEALGDQREAVVVVGAQPIYLHAGTTDLAVPEFTSAATRTSGAVPSTSLEEQADVGVLPRGFVFPAPFVRKEYDFLKARPTPTPSD